jgi:hypothetical protein
MGPPSAVLRFSARLEDGRTASTLDHPLVPSSEPAHPYFSVLGGPGFHINGNQLHTRQDLWLWPRQTSGRFELVVEWPIFDIPATGVSLDVN